MNISITGHVMSSFTLVDIELLRIYINIGTHIILKKIINPLKGKFKAFNDTNEMIHNLRGL